MTRITDIQRFCMHDGPGIRTTVFFKGCPLRCAWCHNPETQQHKPQTLFYREKCMSCGACADGIHDNICPTKARELVGRDVTTEELLRDIQKDAAFYGTDGGVTFSGGECMLQIDALSAILHRCKEHGIHTTVDTSGYVPFSHFERIMPVTDLFLYDIKCLDPEMHQTYVGVDNALILNNLQQLLRAGAHVWIRIPIVPSVNATVEEMRRIKAFLDPLPPAQRVELLPYHAMGDSKYRALGHQPPAFDIPDAQTMHNLRDVFA